MRPTAALFFLLSCVGCGDDDDHAPGDAAVADGGADGDADSDGDTDSDGDGDTSAVLFSMEILHELEIEVDEADLPALDQDRETRVPCTFRFDGEEVEGAGVRLKAGLGSYSPLESKPGFSLKFDEFVDGLEFHDLSKLVLNNMQQDVGMVAEHTGYEMYRSVGIPAPRTSYARLTLNGELYGVYLVKEAINNDFLRSRFGDDSGNLYEGECCHDLALGYTQLRNNGEENGDTSDLAALIDVVEHAPDDTYLADLTALLDVDRFLRGWALEAIIHNWDSYVYDENNFYLYHDPGTDRFVFLPHGADQLFYDVTWHIRGPVYGGVAQRFADDPDLEPLFEDAMREILDDDWDSDAYLAYVDEATTLIAGAVEEDTHKSYSTEAQLAFADHIRDFIRDRPAIVREMLDAICGNGAVEPSEDCDDGDAVENDGCDHICRLEYCGDHIVQDGIGEVCDGRPCRGDCLGFAECGDGALEEWEDCDDGNVASGDGCNASCRVELCGDGAVQPGIGEACDGGLCRMDCSELGACGDGTVDRGEDCDDGNVADGDDCSATCGSGDCDRVELLTGTYLFCTHGRTWVDAKARCEAEGGSMAVPATEEEQDLLAEEAPRHLDQNYWIGVDDREREGIWTDPNGDPVVYAPWREGNPTGDEDQNCVILDSEAGYAWNDYYCTSETNVICRL